MRHLLIKIQPGQEQSLEQVLGQKLPLSDYDITKVSPKKLVLNLLKKQRQQWVFNLCKTILNLSGIQIIKEGKCFIFCCDESEESLLLLNQLTNENTENNGTFSGSN